MPRNLLLNQGASVTGNWVRTEPPAHKTWPFRVVVMNGATPYAGDNIYIEELSNGLPSGAGNPLLPQTQTGKIGVIATIPPDGLANAIAGTVMIEAPSEFLRARTGAFSSGTCDVTLIEAE